MKNWLSRYRPRYLRSLAYMLQQTEYDISEYLPWYRRTPNFAAVEKRKQFVPTAKAKLVLGILWLLTLLMVVVVAGYFYLQYRFLQSYLELLPSSNITMLLISNGALALAWLLSIPYFVPYILLVPLWLINVLIQTPVEAILVARARRRIRHHPGVKLAIAGSFGKTTMKEILQTVLSEDKKVAASVGNQNTPIGISRFVKKLDGDEDILIFEYGEYRPGDVAKFTQLTRPQVGVITGVNEAHLNQFKTVENSAKNIFSLARYLKNQKVYVNAENELSRRYVSPQHHLYSRQGTDGWRVSHAKKTSLAGTEFVAKKGAKTVRAKSHLLGLHQIGPLVAAIAIADHLGLTTAQIEAGIAKTVPFEHRLEPRTRPDGVVVIDDTYNGNPDGVRADLEFLRAVRAKRKVYVTPGLVEMGKRSGEVHFTIGKELAKVADLVVLIRNSVTPIIEAGLKEGKYKGKLLWFEDALECYNSLDSFTTPGDVVLLQNDWPDQYA